MPGPDQSPQVRRPRWPVETLDAKVGVWVAAACWLLSYYYLAVTWDQPRRVVISIVLAGGLAVVTFARRLLPRDERNAELFFGAWAILVVGLIAAVSALDGGVESPLRALLFVPVAFAALAFPARAAIPVAAASVLSFIVLSLANGGFGNGEAGVVGVALASTAALGICQARREAARRIELEAHHETVEESEARFRGGFEHSPVAMAVIGLDSRFELVNDALCRLLGREREWLRDRSPSDVCQPDETAPFEDLFDRLVAGRIDRAEQERRFVHASGRRVSVVLSLSAVRSRDGDVRSIHAQFVDVTAEHEAIERGHRRARQQAVVAAIGQRALEGASVNDLIEEAVASIADTLGVPFSGAFEFVDDGQAVVRSALGYPSGLSVPTDTGETIVGHARRTGRPVLMSDAGTETRFDAALGRRRGLVSGLAVLVPAPEGGFFGGFVTHASTPGYFEVDDVSFLQGLANVVGGALSRKAADDQLRYLSLHDDLTGLPNRTLLLDRLSHAFARAARTGETLAVMFLDVDNFKTVNDAFGHSAGDELLKSLPPRLLWALRAGDTLARFGGDEFVVLSEGLADVAGAQALAERLLASFDRPFSVASDAGTSDHHLSISIGVAVAGPEHAGDPEALIRDADTAMYRAKQRRGGIEVFDARSRADLLDRFRLTNELRGAIDGDEPVLAYQPIVDLCDGTVTRVEALLRWHHPTRGLVTPGEFIPLAEETGLILPLGRWVLERVAAQLADWDGDAVPALRGLRVGINVSARQLAEPGLVEEVEGALARHGVAADRLLCEITETALIEDPVRASENVEALVAAGASVMLDDFGTGYSALEHLKRFPLSAIKLDRTFVADVATNTLDLAVVRGLVEIACAMEIKVVAEGIELADQLVCLRALGCDLAQGFLFAPPLSPSGLAAYLDARPGAVCDLDALATPRSPVRLVASASAL